MTFDLVDIRRLPSCTHDVTSCKFHFSWSLYNDDEILQGKKCSLELLTQRHTDTQTDEGCSHKAFPAEKPNKGIPLVYKLGIIHDDLGSTR